MTFEMKEEEIVLARCVKAQNGLGNINNLKLVYPI